MSLRKDACLPILAAVGVLAGLAGCASVSWDRTKVEKTIHDVLIQQAHVPARSVTCPSKAKIAKGVVTYCSATLSNGDTVRFAATQTNGTGHVHVGPAEMISLEVEDTIRNSLRQHGVTASATCPQHVPIVVGRTFVCTATDTKGVHARIGATISDASAGFRLRVLSSSP